MPIDKVFGTQDVLGAPHLVPTVLLHHPITPQSQLALDIAREAADTDSDAWISIVGSTSFWGAGDELDAHIGALAQLQPAGWSLTVTRENYALPAPVSVSEISGLCRTARPQ